CDSCQACLRPPRGPAAQVLAPPLTYPQAKATTARFEADGCVHGSPAMPILRRSPLDFFAALLCPSSSPRGQPATKTTTYTAQHYLGTAKLMLET
ncbi:hypothetical protein HaLaN_24052, partial [Haematococcus lacustris]